MTRSARTTASLLLALLASSLALSASASGAITTHLTGNQIGINRLDLANGSNVKCSTSSLKGTFSGSTASNLHLDPIYLNCLSSGQETTAFVNNCFFEITAPTETSDSDHHHSTTHIRCPAGKKIEIKVGDPVVSCTVSISEQTPETSAFIDFTDNTTAVPKQDITIYSTLKGIKVNSSGSVCGPSGSAELTGEFTLLGYQDADHTEQVDIWAKNSGFHSKASSIPEYHSSSASGTTYVTATEAGVNQFVLPSGGKLKCGGGLWQGSYSGTTASDLNLQPFYFDCTGLFGFTYISNGCTTTVTGSIQSGGGDSYSPRVHIRCPAGKKIELDFGGCLIEIEEQTPATKIDLTSYTESAPQDIQVKSTLSDIEFSSTGGFCGKSGTMQYQGEMTLRAYSDVSHASAIHLWIA